MRKLILLVLTLAACADPAPIEGSEDGQPATPITVERVSDLPQPGTIGTPIEGYAPYDASIDSISACNHGEMQAGTQAFSSYLASLGMAGNNYASCQTGFHPRGMALDVYAGGFAGLQEFANWLTANDGEMARRLGLNQIFFNSHMWRSYYGGPGKPQGAWAPYSGRDPHTSHVHISFGYDGAAGATSFFRDVLGGGGGGGGDTQSTFTECGWLHVNEAIGTDRPQTSCDGAYALAMQGDGNLVLYGRGAALWSSGTYGGPGRIAIMQGDGNFVIYTPGGSPVWASGTAGWDGAELAVQTDGNVVLYWAGTPLWDTGTWQ